MGQRRRSLVIAMAVGAASGGILGAVAGSVVGSAATTVGVTVAGGNGAGSAANQLNDPTSAVGSPDLGGVWVSDTGNNRVQEWSVNTVSTTGVTVAGGNGAGSAANQLDAPMGLSEGGSGLIIADSGNNRVQEWASGATSGTTAAGGNGVGSAANQLNDPTGVTADSAGDVYVADSGNNRVQKWAPGATAGVTVAGGNGAGSAANQLSDPASVSVDGSGDVYVADSANNRVQEWAPGAAAGVTVAGGNGVGSGANQLSDPTGVDLVGGGLFQGYLEVTDSGNNRVQQFAPGATAGVTVAGGNGAGSGADQLSGPMGAVTLNAPGSITVADAGNNRVQEFGQPPPNTAPVVSSNPANVTAFAGDTVSFSADATGTPTPTVQWQLSLNAGSTWSDFNGATSTTLTITNVTLPDSGAEFRAVFTNVAGSATTNPATLTVNPDVSPVVTTQPTSQTVFATDTVSFGADAGGTPTPTVQWQQSTDGGSTWSDIAGATSTPYTITNVPLSDNGFEFRAVFTNVSGSATTNPATLTVNPAVAPVVTLQPIDQTVTEGGVVSFTAAASGGPPPSVQWQQSTDGGSTWSDIAGATSTPYTITNVPLSDTGVEFRAVFTNGAGSATTNAATLTVVPITTSVLVPANGATVSGTTWLDASAPSFNSVASLRFEVSGGSISNHVVVSGTLTLVGWLGVWDTHDVPNGTYTLQSVATDSLGNVATSSPITVTVNNPPLQTAVVLPANGATVSGSAWLDASANGPSDISGVQYVLSGGSISNQVIATATATLYGWLARWNTASVPNGTYTLQSVATEVGGTTATGPGITVTVAN